MDDNPDVAESTGSLIELTGCDVKVCHSGPEALAVAGDFHPDVGILDLNMPGMDGDALARWLRVQAAGRPLMLLAVTAMNSEEDRRRIERAGFDRHLVKPVEPDRLLAEVVDAVVAAKAGAKGLPADAAGDGSARMGARIDQVSAELRDRLAALADLTEPNDPLPDRAHNRLRSSHDRLAESQRVLGRAPEARPADAVDHIRRFADGVLRQPEGRQAAALACAVMYLVSLLRPGSVKSGHAEAAKAIVDEVFAGSGHPAPPPAPRNGTPATARTG